MLEASSSNQLFQRKCLESFYIDHDLFIFLLRCLFIATLKCSRASLAPGGRNLCLVLWVGVSGESGVTKICASLDRYPKKIQVYQFWDVKLNRDGVGFASAARLVKSLF